jgi:C4-dicarboxylate transporter, DctM subunit
VFPVEWYVSGPAIIAMLLVFVGLGVPVAFSMGLSGFVGVLLFLPPNRLHNLGNIFYDRGTEFTFVVVPMFILMAALIAQSGLAAASYTAAQRWLNRLPGSLAASSIVAATAFAAISGSSPATAATIGLVSVPEMIKRGYSARMATGAVAAGGTLGALIPPSVVMIIYGIVTETSIGKLFIAGIVPGLLLSALLILYTVAWARLAPGTAPSLGTVSWRERWSALKPLWGVIVLFFAVMGSIYSGAATVEEAAAVGVAVAFIAAVVNGEMSLARLRESLLQAARTSAMVMFLLGSGFFLSFLMASLNVPQGLAEVALASGLNRWVLFLGFTVVLIVLGFVMETISIMIIFMPLVFPLFVKMGFDPIWIGVVTTVNVEIGMITPPVGLNLFVLRSVLPAEVSTRDVLEGGLVYTIPMLLGLGLVIAFPGLSTWLLTTMG